MYKGESDIFKSDFLHRADQALYRAKQLGRNQIYLSYFAGGRGWVGGE